jgi:hypothetical protein
MLRSISTKDETILYDIGYDIVLGCLVISGVTSYGQPKCSLTDIGLVTKLSCGWISCTSTPTCVASVFGTTSYRKVLSFSFINLFNPQKDNSWTHVQHVNNMNMLMQFL